MPGPPRPRKRELRGGSSLGWGDSALAPRLTAREPRWVSLQLLAEARALAVTASPGFDLSVATSSIPNAGLGVHVGDAANGKISSNSVVALYPGVYMPLVPLHARAAACGETVTDILHMARLWGYGVVDSSLSDISFEEASSYWLILEEHSGLMDGFRPELRVGSTGRHSPFAVGHLVNHPPQGTAPNVTWREFAWGEDAGELATNRLHRGLWYIDPITLETVDMPSEEGEVRLPLPGVAIVALRDLVPGEELFMDYKLSKPHPPWYTPVT